MARRPGNPEGPQLVPPSEVLSPAPSSPMGPSRLAEWLMVDVRVAKVVARGTELFSVCEALSHRNACGIISGTLVIDLLDASEKDRAYLLDRGNWPKPGGQQEEGHG